MALLDVLHGRQLPVLALRRLIHRCRLAVAAASSFRQKGTLQSTEKEVKKKVVAAKGGVACSCTRSSVVI